MTRFSFPVAAAAVALALLGLAPRPAGAAPATLVATGDATFTQDVLQATGPVLVEFGEFG
jgi:hypothetical protein